MAETTLSTSEPKDFLKDETPSVLDSPEAAHLAPPEGTPLKGYNMSSVYRIVDMTAPFLSAPFVASAGQALRPGAGLPEHSFEVFASQPDVTRIELVNADRLQLLVRKFVMGQLSPEDTALFHGVRTESRNRDPSGDEGRF